MPRNEPNASQVLVVPHKSALLAGHENILHVLVRVQAPDATPGEVKTRPPYRIAFVLDRSGSMSGAPIFEARRCVASMLARLKPDDEAALVAFDHRVQTRVPCRPVGDRQFFLEALAMIDSGGNTDIYGGWEAGAKEAAPVDGTAALNRVLILSDGNANHGVREPGAMAEGVRAVCGQSVTTSTYGLGRNFNEDLMIGLAQAGGGNHYYGETAADLMDPFAEEFDLLADLWARNVTLSIQAAEGVRVVLRNAYEASVDRVGSLNVRLPDLAYGSEAWALFEVRVPWREDMADAPAPILQVQVTGQQIDGVPAHFPPAALALPSLSAPAWNSVATEELVTRRDGELRAAALLHEAVAAARSGNTDEMERIVQRAMREFGDNPWVKSVLAELDALRHDAVRFAKSASYSALKMNRRLSEKEEMLAEAEGSRSYLRRKANPGRGDPPADEPPGGAA